MKIVNRNETGVSPVIAVILMVAITVVLAGVVFLWAQSFTNEADQDVQNLSVRGGIDVDEIDTGTTTYSVLEIEVIEGNIDWSEYKVTLNGTEVNTVADTSTAPAATDVNNVISNAGDTVYFSDPSFTGIGDGTLQVGVDYEVKIINIADNKLVWEDDIRATV